METAPTVTAGPSLQTIPCHVHGFLPAIHEPLSTPVGSNPAFTARRTFGRVSLRPIPVEKRRLLVPLYVALTIVTPAGSGP